MFPFFGISFISERFPFQTLAPEKFARSANFLLFRNSNIVKLIASEYVFFTRNRPKFFPEDLLVTQDLCVSYTKYV
ncbi:hypothetical protein B1H38_04895 [Leptospira borgpetersenii serovar Ballum]|nr:hypothetical protein IQ66_17980 [Leptospira borgpetersenii serovar Ballum]OOV45351.1 hypothetical protein B1H38_04895 [Leptospira borgpetersenii serovar Ballum]